LVFTVENHNELTRRVIDVMRELYKQLGHVEVGRTGKRHNAGLHIASRLTTVGICPFFIRDSTDAIRRAFATRG
jgi:hypothetical protein